VPCFGSLPSAVLATVGLNPSNREFVDLSGHELQGEARRFHTLKSLGLDRWSEVKEEHLHSMSVYCQQYFWRNPYNLWFKRLEHLVSGISASYYARSGTACHLDLVPYATTSKWNTLKPFQRSALSDAAGDTLGQLIRDSSIRILVLNGTSVARQFEELSDVPLKKTEHKSWALARASGTPVTGFSYEAMIHRFANVNLGRGVLVLGFNHNVQSSFGISARVLSALRGWIARKAKEPVQ